MVIRLLQKGFCIILLTTSILIGITLYTEDMTNIQNIFRKKISILSKEEILQSHNKISKKQIIVWSKVRSGSSFLGELLRKWNFFYSFEPIATLWPSIGESSNMTASVNASTIVKFLRDILLCNFKKYPKYVRNCFMENRSYQNILMDELCTDESIELCDSFELMAALCETAEVHVAKVVRLNLRHSFELLQIPQVHSNSSLMFLNHTKTMEEEGFQSRVMNSKNSLEIMERNLDHSNHSLDETHEVLNYSEIENLKHIHLKQRILRNRSKILVTESEAESNNFSHMHMKTFMDRKHFDDIDITHEANVDLNLQIIHLVRDPRSTLKSRRENPWLSGLTYNARALCDELNDELKYAAELKRLSPSRYRLIRYEWLVLDVETNTKDLYDWLNLPYTIDVANYIAYHSMGLIVDSTFYWPFTTFRNSSANAFKWRETLDFEDMLSIQRDCKEALDALGYRLYHNLRDYLDPQLSPMLAKTFLD